MCKREFLFFCSYFHEFPQIDAAAAGTVYICNACPTRPRHAPVCGAEPVRLAMFGGRFGGDDDDDDGGQAAKSGQRRFPKKAAEEGAVGKRYLLAARSREAPPPPHARTCGSCLHASKFCSVQAMHAGRGGGAVYPTMYPRGLAVPVCSLRLLPNSQLPLRHGRGRPQHVRLVLLFLRCRDGRWGGGGTRYRAVLWRGTCMYVCRPDSLYLRRQGLATYLVTYLRRDGEGNFLFIFLFYLLIYLFIYFFPFFILFGLLTTYIQRSKPQQQRNLTYSSSVPVPVRSCPFLFFRHPHTHIQSDTASPRTRKYVSTYVRRMAARKQGEREGEKSAGLALSRSMGHRVDRRM